MRLTFPLPAESLFASTNATRTAMSVPSGLRILLVDDDPLLHQSLRSTLEGDGHTVDVANGGQAGIDPGVDYILAKPPKLSQLREALYSVTAARMITAERGAAGVRALSRSIDG